MKTRWLYAAVGILVLVHLLLLVPALQHPERFQTRDSLDYLDLARTLMTTGRFSGTDYPGVDLVRSPGYPLFVLLGLWLGRGGTAIISLLQVLVLLATAGLLYSISSQLGHRKAGLAAVIIFLLNPNAAFWANTLMSETLAGFLLVLGFWCLVRYWKTGQRGWLLGAGLSLSAGALTRPILYPISILLSVVFLWLEWRRTRSPIQAVKVSAILLIGVLALVLPWQYRNMRVHAQFTLSEVGESTFENWLVAKTLASAEGYSRDEASAMIAKSPNPLQYSLQVIARYPLVFVKEQARGIMRTLLGAEYGTWAKAWGGEEVATTGVLSAFLDQGSPGEMLRSLGSQVRNPWFWVGMYALGYDVLLGVALLVGAWRAWRDHRPGPVFSLLVLVGLSVLYLLVVPGVAGESRFRVPADPLLALIAGWAFLSRKGKEFTVESAENAEKDHK